VNDQAYGAIRCRKRENYIVIDLADGPADASAAQIAPDLAELCEQIACDDDVRVVLISFSGEMKKGIPPEPDPFTRLDCVSLTESVAGLKQPVIAAINGDAIGFGLELALACDIRIGVENARFGLPQIQQGQMQSDGGTQRLPRLIGQSRAMQMILTGDLMNAGEACRVGLISRIVPSESLMNAAMDMAREMAGKSPLSLSYAKEAIYKGIELTLEQGIRLELDLYLHLFTTADRIEGITAYKEKRKPKFEGV
jgi:enoyl-CoA hydratase/carnithine racemase